MKLDELEKKLRAYDQTLTTMQLFVLGLKLIAVAKAAKRVRAQFSNFNGCSLEHLDKALEALEQE